MHWNKTSFFPNTLALFTTNPVSVVLGRAKLNVLLSLQAFFIAFSWRILGSFII